MKFLLDTNICIYLMNHHSVQVAEHFKRVRPGDVVMSIVTYAELWAGVERCIGEPRRQAEASIIQLKRRVSLLPFDEAAAQAYGVLRAAVPDRRRNAFDRLIAAHALSRNITLVTNNEGDFKDYPGLKLENWVASHP